MATVRTENLSTTSVNVCLEPPQSQPNSASDPTQDQNLSANTNGSNTYSALIEKLPNELLLFIGEFLLVPYDQAQKAQEQIGKKFKRLGPRAHKAWATKLVENGILDHLRLAAVNKRFRAVYCYEFWKSAAFTPDCVEEIDDDLGPAAPLLCLEVAMDAVSHKRRPRHHVGLPAMASRPLLPSMTRFVVNMSISAHDLAILDARSEAEVARAPHSGQFLGVEFDLTSLRNLRISCDLNLHSIGWEHGSRPIAADWNRFALGFYTIVLPSIESARVFWQRRLARLPGLRKLEAHRHYATGSGGGHLIQVSTVREVAGRPELISQQTIPFTEAIQAMQRSDEDIVTMIHEMIRKNGSA